MQLPELTPTKQPADMAGQEFLLPWQKTIDLLGGDPLRHLTLMAIVGTTAGVTVPDLASNIDRMQGQESAIRIPRTVSRVGNFVRRLIDGSFCRGTMEKARHPGAPDTVRVMATDAGRDCMSLLGVLGTWQLKHGVAFSFLAGQRTSLHSEQPYDGAATRRLRMLQQIVVEGKTSVERVRSIMPAISSETILFNLNSMHDEGLLDFYSKFNPQHRLVKIVGDKPTETSKRRGEPLIALAEACDNFLKQGRRRLSLYELVAEAQRLHPTVTRAQLTGRISATPLSFLEFCDQEVLGYSDGKKTDRSTFLIKPEYRGPAEELLTSIFSLDNRQFRNRAVAAAYTILSPTVAKKFLSLPTDWEHASPFSPVPEPLLKKAKALAEGKAGLDYEVMKKSLEKLFELEILVDAGEAKVVFADSLRGSLSPTALRLLLRAKKLEVLFYGNVLSRDEIGQRLHLGGLSVEDFIKYKLLPLVYRLVTSDRKGARN